jgi:ABC-type glycerol-3-phosphate transport system permease component
MILNGNSVIRGKRVDWSGITLYGLLSVLAVLMLAPLIYLVSTAFKPESELFLFPPRFFVMNPTTQSFSDLLFAAESSLVPFTRYIFNSIIVSATVVLISIVISAMAAYPLSKHRSMPFNKAIFRMVVLGLMFAPQVTQIPQYLIMSRMGLIDTYAALILPGLAAPLGLFLMKQFLDQLPDVLLEAGRIDGANEWVMFRAVIMPLLTPAMATLALFSFIATWNDPWSAMVYTTSDQMKTLPFAVQTISGGYGVVARVGAVAAASFLMIIPTLIVFVFTQRKVLETMAHSGIKG